MDENEKPTIENLYARSILMQAQITSIQEAIFGYLETLPDKSISRKAGMIYSSGIQKYLQIESDNSPYDINKIGPVVKVFAERHWYNMTDPDL